MEFQSARFFIFLTKYFIAFDFISLSALNYNLNSVLINIILTNLNLSHFVSVNLLDNCLMCLNISLIALKISKPSRSILINLQPIFFFLLLFVFLFHSQNSCGYDNFNQFLLQVYDHENLNQSYNLTHYFMFACFFLQMNFFYPITLIFLCLK